MITLRQLKYLEALARHRHFGKAADSCAITQPALSMQIRELEKFLGVQLVERRSGDVSFTEIGAEIVRRGEHVNAAARDLVDFARQSGQLLSGRLTLGVIPSIAPYVLPHILPVLQSRYANLRIELRETQTKPLIEELDAGSIDVVMLALRLPEADLETMRLFEDPFLLAIPASDPVAFGRTVTAEDIDPQRLILLEEGHCLRDQALAYCTRGRRDSPMNLGATSLATVMQMVANGYGITLVPQIAIDVEVRDGRITLLPFSKPQPGRTVGLAWRRTSPRKADFVALGALIIEALESSGEAASKRAAHNSASRSKAARFSRQ